MYLITPRRLSTVVGAIYDCAVDPQRWSNAMREICTDLGCMFGNILLFDLGQSQVGFFKGWNNNDVDLILRNPQYIEDLMLLTRPFPIATLPIDEPILMTRRFTDAAAIRAADETRYMREIAGPRGDGDALATVVARNGQRIGMFVAVRHKSEGYVTENDLAIMRLFAPHVRRAITISDLMELKLLEAQALSATLDRLAMGVVVVAGENHILHANEPARRMLANGGRIVSRRGRLAARDAAADAELSQAIELARSDESALGTAGIGVSLGSADAQPALAHVLPLARGVVRTRLLPRATAAVFINTAEPRPQPDLRALAQTYGLTPAEARVAERLLAGAANLAEVAASLDVSLATVKTHLSQVFAKTGVARQSDLVGLMHRMMPSAR
jgi:DNA-binding CsgD family transcriptional regulator/PAS domain-containing protein